MNRKSYVFYNFKCTNRAEGLFKVTSSQTYAKQVLISQKRYKIGTQLLQITDRKWYVAY